MEADLAAKDEVRDFPSRCFFKISFIDSKPPFAYFLLLLQRVRSLEDEMERMRGAASDSRARTISSGSGNDPGEH